MCYVFFSSLKKRNGLFSIFARLVYTHVNIPSLWKFGGINFVQIITHIKEVSCFPHCSISSFGAIYEISLAARKSVHCAVVFTINIHLMGRNSFSSCKKRNGRSYQFSGGWYTHLSICHPSGKSIQSIPFIRTEMWSIVPLGNCFRIDSEIIRSPVLKQVMTYFRLVWTPTKE